MVRPNGTLLAPKERSGEAIYKIVCGERRYRAAEAAGITEIPAVVRDMSDEEALEIQIIENLQRKDVNPMEEAVAFSSLKNSWTVKEISLKVGKSEAYVMQRISLTNLVPEWQEIVYAGKITLTDAYKLARVGATDQKTLFKDCVDKHWQKDSEVIEIGYRMDEAENDLGRASFDIKDAELYPEAGSCVGCRFNSHSNQLLFPDLNKKKICHNGACFQIKSSHAYTATLEKAMADPEMLFVCATSYLANTEKPKIKAAKDLGIAVLEYDQFEVIREPDPLQNYDEFIAEYKSDNDFDDMDAAEQKEALRDWKNDYDNMQEEYANELKAYETGVKTARKAFVIVGSWNAKEGSVVSIALKSAKGKKLEASADDPADRQILAIDQEIAGIKERSIRNQELDREKVQSEMYNLFETDKNAFLNDDHLDEQETVALILAFCEACYDVKEYVKDLLNVHDDYNNRKLYDAIKKNRGILGIEYPARLFIKSKLLNKNNFLDPGKYDNAAAMLSVGMNYFQKEILELEAQQCVKADKRETSANKRLEALEAKKLQLKEDLTRQQNEKAAKVAQDANKSTPGAKKTAPKASKK